MGRSYANENLMRNRILLLGLMACVALLLAAAFTLAAPAKAYATPVDYIYRDWDGTKVVEEQRHEPNCQELNDIPGDGYVLSGWYIARSFSDGDRPKVQGTANIIIENGREMSLRNGIEVPEGSTLNIYTNVWPDGTKDIGKLYVGRSEADTAAIGGNSGKNSGTINIYGGTIDVTGGSKSNHGGAGIGGGWKGSGTVNIYGGNISAKGGNEGAGIGGGSNKEGKDSTGGGSNNIKIYGGTVNAEGWYGAGIGGGEYGKGGTIMIFGGDVTAKGGADAAGIGGGEERDGGNIKISGGTVNAKGGSVTSKGGAGIGGGGKGSSGTINISGGTVNAKGGAYAAGIGGGDEGEGNNITISGGNVTAIADTQSGADGGGGAGIGGGDEAAGKNITISGGTVSATGGTKRDVFGGAGIGGGSKHNGEDIKITGGNITKAQGGADAAGIGGGDGGTGAVRIESGTVNAHGGSKSDGGGAGIGGGQKQSATVTITGGAITATGGGDGAGIGGGEDGSGGTITISAGTITANGGVDGAGIGGGQDGNGGTITISGGTVNANGGKHGAGIGGGEEGQNGGTILINGTARVTAKGGEEGAGIGGGYKGGFAGSVTIKSGNVTATGGHLGAGIGTGRWSHLHGDSYYQSAVNVTIEGGTVNAQGGTDSAGIGGGYVGPSGVIKISGGSVYAKGGKNGGSGIGTGGACFHKEITTVNIEITGGTIKAVAGNMDGATNNTKSDPGAAIGAGGTDQEASIGDVAYESYFTGDIWLSGGTIEAYAADVTHSGSTKAATLNVIGTTDSDSRDWQGDKGQVHFNGATVDMYPGPGTSSGAIKQVVKAADTSEGGILFTDNGGMYQRVTYATMNGSVSKMKEAKDTSRYVVLTGAEGAVDFEGTAEQVNYYKRVRVEPVHKHDFDYSLKIDATDNIMTDTIVAKCENQVVPCSLENAEAELTIAAPTLKYYRQTGEGISAEVTVIDNGHIRNGAQVEYYKANDEMTGKLTDEYSDPIKLTQAPTVPGKYWAEITLDGVTTTKPENIATAHVVYEIAKAQGTAEVTVEKSPSETNPQTINLTDCIRGILPLVDADYAEDTTTSITLTIDPASAEYGCTIDGAVLTAGTKPGDVIVNVSVKEPVGNGTLETMAAKITVHVIEKKPQVITADDMTIILGETNKKINARVTTPSTGGGALSYTVKADEWSGSSNLPIAVNSTTGDLTVQGLGTAYVTITAAAVAVVESGETVQYGVTTKVIKVTVTKKLFEPTVTLAGWTYGDTPKTPTISGLPNGVTSDNVTYEYKVKDADDLDYDEYVPGSSYYGPTKAGDYTLRATVAETSEYASATCTVDFSIAKKAITASVWALDKEYDGTTDATVYAYVDDQDVVDGDYIEIDGVTGVFVNKKAGENKSVALDASEMTLYGDNAESYEVTIPVSATASIEKAWAMVAAVDEYVPLNTAELPELTAIDYTPVEGEQIEYQIHCDADTTILGTYEIVVTADPTTEVNSNYDVTCFNGTLTITRPIEVNAQGYSGTYDGQEHGITVIASAPDIPSIDSDYSTWTAADWAEFAEWVEYLEVNTGGLNASSTPEQWVAWADSVNLKQALAELQWVSVYYGTKELTIYNFETAGGTTNPTYTDAGTYPVYYFVVAMDGQTVAGSEDVVIEKANPEVTAPTPATELQYDGNPQQLIAAPGSTNGGTMEYSLDGMVWYADPTVIAATKVGSYPVYYHVKGNDNYNDVAPKAVVAAIRKAPTWGVYIENWTYGSEASKPEFGNGVESINNNQVVSFSYKPKGASDSAYTDKAPTLAGDYIVRCIVDSSATDHNGTYYANFSVEPKPVTATVLANDKAYDGTTDAAVYAFVYDGVLDGDSVSISGVTGTFSDKNAGENKEVIVDGSTATISGDGSSNYKVAFPGSTVATIEKAWAIVAADDVTITVGEALPNPLKAYAYAPVVGEKLEYSICCDSDGTVGEHAIYVLLDPDAAANRNYDVTCIDGKLTINKAELSVSAEGYSGTYDGKPHSISVTVAPEAAKAKVYYSTERELTADNCQIAGSLLKPTFTDAGTHHVYYCVIAPNYKSVAGFKDVVIAKADPAVTAPAPVTGLAWTGEPQALVVPGTSADGIMEYSLDGTTWSKDVPTATEVGSYLILYRVTVDANYNDAAPAYVSATIAKADISKAKVTLSPASYTYDGTAKEPSVTATLGDKALVKDADYTVSYADNVNAGTATATITGINNYKGTASATFAIAQDNTPEPEPVALQPMYRLYNPYSGEHFYTASAAERDNLMDFGWQDEGVCWIAPESSNTPVYRLYNSYAGEHHYTTEVYERDLLVGLGWTDEGIGWYSDDAKTVNVYREYNPNEPANNHNYSANKFEHDNLISLGWVDEGVAWYGAESAEAKRSDLEAANL